MQLKRTWCCSQLLYHNKNRFSSQSGRAPCWGMICHKSTLKCSENHNAFLEMSHMTRVRAENAFTYFRGWPEAVIWSSVFPQEAGSQAPLQGWRGERETAGVRAGSTGGPKGHPHPSGTVRWDAVHARKPFVVRYNGTLRANVSLQRDILLLECLPPLRQFYKLGAGLGVILQIRKATSRPSFTHKPMSARSNYLIKSIKFDLTSILHQLLIRPAHFDTHM